VAGDKDTLIKRTAGTGSRAWRSRRRRRRLMGRLDTGKLTVIFDYQLDGSVIR